MALYISEYASMLVLSGGQVPIGAEPSSRSQALEVGDASQVSEPFGPSTKFVRVHAEGACSLKFGRDPIATQGDARMSANTTEMFAVQGGHRVAVIGSGRQSQDADGVFALLQTIADPKAVQTRLAELKATADNSAKTLAEAKAASAELERTKTDLAAREKALAQQSAALAATQQALEAQAAKLKAEREAAYQDLETRRKADSARAQDLTAKTAALESARQSAAQTMADTEAAMSRREKAIAAREQLVTAREQAVAVSEQTYSTRMARLKELAG
jgi:uncharacterized protein (DUF3084 family)